MAGSIEIRFRQQHTDMVQRSLQAIEELLGFSLCIRMDSPGFGDHIYEARSVKRIRLTAKEISEIKKILTRYRLQAEVKISETFLVPP